MRDQINMERLWEASDEQLAAAHANALDRAHNAPKNLFRNADGTASLGNSDAWARFSREANRIGDEIARRSALKPHNHYQY